MQWSKLCLLAPKLWNSVTTFRRNQETKRDLSPDEAEEEEHREENQPVITTQ